MAESQLLKFKNKCQNLISFELSSRISRHYNESQRDYFMAPPNRCFANSSLTRLKCFKSKFNRRTFLFKGAFILMGGVCYEFYLFRKYFRATLPENPSAVGDTSSSLYVYESDPMRLYIPIWRSFISRLSLPSFITHCREPIWHFIQETNSTDPIKKDAAIQTLARMNGLSDMECYAISSSISFKTAIALANSAADPRLIPVPRSICNYKGSLPGKMREILSTLPSNFIHEDVLKAAKLAIISFDPTYEEYYENQLEQATSFESDLHAFTNPTRRLSEINFLKPCLNAILSHTRLTEQIPAIDKLEIPHMLAVVAQKHSDNIEIMGIIVKIISNVTCHPQAAEYIEKAGLLRLISELSLNPEIKLSLPARKALQNLDRKDTNDPVFLPGVFQLYPSFRFEDKRLDIDVIFVHGIMGGVFRTWRQDDTAYSKGVGRQECQLNTNLQDRTPDLRNQRSIPKELVAVDLELEAELDEEAKSMWVERIRSLRNSIFTTNGPKLIFDKKSEYKPANREFRDGILHYLDEHEKIILEPDTTVPTETTKCWPMDWIPKDCHGVRIIAVDFESFVTRWNPILPIESLSRSIFERSAEILEKLHSADVGKRPIIWVCHSAGGLLVKQLLLQASSSPDPKINCVSLNTEAVLFYSTPHFGAQLGAMSTAGKIFLLPTLEIKELSSSADSFGLELMNSEFKGLLDKHSYRIVSFGDTAKILSTGGIPLKLVSLKSADPGFGEYYAVDLNHLEICKPVSRGSFIYRKLIDVIDNVRSTSDKFRNKPELCCDDK